MAFTNTSGIKYHHKEMNKVLVKASISRQYWLFNEKRKADISENPSVSLYLLGIKADMLL